jgi:hypothetical protein
LIINEDAFYYLADSKELDKYLGSILHLAECPVLIVRQKFKLPHELLAAYDGSESAVYALK